MYSLAQHGCGKCAPFFVALLAQDRAANGAETYFTRWRSRKPGPLQAPLLCFLGSCLLYGQANRLLGSAASLGWLL
jgi:hypothetical protein